MYCFSHICRICLENCGNEFKNVRDFDFDNIQIQEKLKFCIPEITDDNEKLPDYICNNCQVFLKQMFNFKQMSITNTQKLKHYVSQFEDNTSLNNSKSNLLVVMNVDSDINELNVVNKNEEVEQTDSEGVSMYSISLNQWDLFETKFTCRCIKEYNSFTENTTHLCKNCEGELLGFQLSKIKVGMAENKYNGSLTNEESESGSPTSANIERGFDYNDLLLCNVHVNGVNKQINIIQSRSYTETLNYSNNDSSTKAKQFICPICSKNYTRRLNLYNHFAKHENCTVYSCAFCKDKFIDKDEFDQHLLQHAPIKCENSDNLTCTTCDKVFSHKSQLAVHLVTHFDKRQFQCSICNKEFFEKHSLEEHKQVHMSGRKYQCPSCGKSYNYKSNLRRHQKQHNLNKFYCLICKAKFLYKGDLENHICHVHISKPKEPSVFKMKPGDKNYCQICKIHFSINTSMKKHMKTHMRGNIFKCNICQLDFNNRFILLKHKQTHAQLTSFRCDKCQKFYMSKHSLNRHYRLSH